MYVHDINPVLANFGPLEIRYYSLAYIIGALAVYFLVKFLIKKRKIALSKNQLMDLITYALLGVVIGGRLGYVLFYNLSYYLHKPLEILAVWHGGMSFHGGMIGAFLAVYYYCRKNNINFWKIADIVVIPIPIALFLGRVGNFINGELYGRITDVSWAVKFPDADGYRHPSQLYEAFKNIIIFTSLWFLRKKKLADGFIFWLFITLYGLLRFVIEFFRQPDAQIGLVLGLSRGQFLCIIMFVVGFYMLLRLKRKK